MRALAWIWSAHNLILGIAVYHRLFIYVGFNGMTRMRTVGLLGISAVIAGFTLVVWKITRGRDFWWLIQRQLWAVAFAVLAFAVLPVDAIVHSYNVGRILAGDPAPSVQISGTDEIRRRDALDRPRPEPGRPKENSLPPDQFPLPPAKKLPRYVYSGRAYAARRTRACDVAVWRAVEAG